MFAYFKGSIEKKDDLKVIIDVNGIGYEIYMPAGDIDRLNIGEITKIHTFTDIKEGYIGIFGFLEEEALSVFEKLKKVSGIGSKTALGVLSHMSPSEVCMSIANEDSTLISKVPGIGAKTAARIILELKDKILKETDIKPTKIASKKETTNNSKNEAVLALKVLGYTTTQINEVIDELDIEGLKVEEIIKKALSNMNKR
ncbi:MAG: Holliday junction branch migration protein RuvA [Clostridia bacterium]|nr:Holliday junction branch migration protein RuvA [Clostridia bacterium]MBR6640592.1 Holliday junction branch migration protein RuvA [Clostridia bacterium]